MSKKDQIPNKQISINFIEQKHKPVLRVILGTYRSLYQINRSIHKSFLIINCPKLMILEKQLKQGKVFKISHQQDPRSVNTLRRLTNQESMSSKSGGKV